MNTLVLKAPIAAKPGPTLRERLTRFFGGGAHECPDAIPTCDREHYCPRCTDENHIAF